MIDVLGRKNHPIKFSCPILDFAFHHPLPSYFLLKMIRARSFHTNLILNTVKGTLMKMLKLIVATLAMVHTTKAADVSVMLPHEPGPMLHMHSRGVLCQTTKAQNYNIENDDFDFSKLTEDTMKTLHTSLHTLEVLHRCAVFQEDLMKKRREAVERGDDNKALHLTEVLRDLDKPTQIIQTFMNDYPSFRTIDRRRKESGKCIKKVIEINVLTFPYFRNLLS